MSWNSILLSDIADFSNGVNFDKSSYTKGVKLIGVSNFGERFYPNYDELEEIKTDVVRPNDYLQEGDIVFVRSNGNKELVGRCMMIANPPSKVTYSGFCIRCRIKDTSYVLPKFLTYYFKSTAFRNAISGSAIGANIQNLSQGKLASHRFLIPDINIQRRIASILSAYDDLIENNRRQIKLLEEAAQRLYREWFVELRFPGHEGVKVVDGVPEGWMKRSIDDIANYLNGYAFKPADWGMEGKPIIKIKELNEGITANTPRNTGEDIPAKYIVHAGDIIFSWSATLTAMIWDSEDGLLNQHLFKVSPCTGIAREFVLQSILKALDEFANLTTGSTMKHIQRGKLKQVHVAVPDKSIMTQYEVISNQIREQILLKQKQIANLIEARDRLFPKLINGKMEVSE